MKKFLPILFFIFFATSPAVMAEEGTEKTDIAPATTYAVTYYAEWCGSCKILVPKVNEVKEDLPVEVSSRLEFVKFDFTDESSKEASKSIANQKGLLDLYLNDAKTGQLKLVDIETGAVLGIIKKDQSAEEIKGALTAISTRS